jgi:hypothetical protein
MEDITREVVCSLWGCHYVDWYYLGLGGVSRGILLMWDSLVVEKIEDYMGNFVVAMHY